MATGVLLFNGYPPNYLPHDITNHELYARTFGDVNFETMAMNNGMLQTINMIGGYIYKFKLLEIVRYGG